AWPHCRIAPLARGPALPEKSPTAIPPTRSREPSLPDLRRLLRLLPRQLPLVRGRARARRHGAARADRTAAPARAGDEGHLAARAALHRARCRDRRAFALQHPPAAPERVRGGAGIVGV